MSRLELHGRLVLPDRLLPGRLAIEGGTIVAVEADPAAARGPILAPGFIDVHVHGWGGHDAMGVGGALDGMARGLLRHGVTSFLPTAIASPMDALAAFGARVRAWMPTAPADGAEPLGFNLEGPLLAPARKGAHDPAFLRTPDSLTDAELAAVVDGLRIITIAPELPGALPLIARLAALGVHASLGHSAATLEEARAGYAAGATTTTHLFNAMSGVDHRTPGLAVAALTTDDAWLELIADGIHVDRSLWPIVVRTKPADRLLLVSDALPVAGMGDGRAMLGTLEVEVKDGRCTLVVGGNLAGSVVGLDSAVRNVAADGIPLERAVAAASTNPAALLGARDRGAIEAGRRADLVELTDELRVRRVMRGGAWVAEGAA